MIDCPAEYSIPLPTKSGLQSSKLDYVTMRDRARAAVKASALLVTQGYKDKPEDEEFTEAVAQATLRAAATNREVPHEQFLAAVNTPAGALYANSLLSAYDMEIVQDAKRLRHYVTNKLIIESENVDARIRIKALELLGKVSDVGLFTERTEVTVNNRSTVELENSLRDKLRKLLNKDAAEDATYTLEQSMPVTPTANVTPAKALAGL